MKIKIFVILGLVALCLPLGAMADGGLVSPRARYVYESEQSAVIFFEDGVEKLAVTVKYQGSAVDFGWILPVPNKPEVDKVSKDLFKNINELTMPHNGVFLRANEPGGSLGLDGDDGFQKTVTIVNQKTIDYYNIVVLQSTDSGDLFAWLDENGYKIPSEHEYLLDDYIENNWYFVAVKIDPLLDEELPLEISRSGQITPLMMTFKTPNIIFPLKISQMSVSSSNSISVRLYVIADSRKQAAGFRAEFANKFSARTLKNLASDEDGNPWFESQSSKYWVTRLTDTMTAKDMKEDLLISDSIIKGGVGVGPGLFTKTLAVILVALYVLVGLIFVTIFIALSPAGFLFIIPGFILLKERSKKVRVICHVMKYFSVAIYFIGFVLSVYFSYVVISDAYISHYKDTAYQLSVEYIKYVYMPVLAFVFLAIFLAEIIYLVKIYKKRNKLI